MSDRAKRAGVALPMVVASTVLGLMGTDLVLPAVPSLPQALSGTPAEAQLVLAAYVAGTCVGLLAFGALGDRFATRTLFVASLLLTSLISFACASAADIWTLIALRAVQGAVAAGPAVFAPGIIRAIYDEQHAVRAIGVLGSVESLAPALAPILGAWLLTLGDWRLSFELIGGAALALAAAQLALPSIPQTSRRTKGGYVVLISDPVFLRYALSQAFVLGGLLVFVFGAPAVIVNGLGGSLTDFIVMQVCGVGGFVLTANFAAGLAQRFGPERMIAIGTWIAAGGATLLFVYAIAGGSSSVMITAAFMPVGIGLGLRGPPGFYRAVEASHGDDARGAALVVLAIMASAAVGTGLVAPFIDKGLAPLAAVALLFQLAAVACLMLLPKFNATRIAE